MNRIAVVGGMVLSLVMHSTAGSESHPDWLGKLYTLENDGVRVVVAPEIGRIITFHAIGGAEWMKPQPDAPVPRSQPWPSYPGDKIWTSAQFLWPQIYVANGPDPVVDRDPWRVVAADEHSIVLESGLSPELGVTVRREIRLGDAAEKTVTQDWTIRRERESAYPVCVWAVTSCALADRIIMPVADPERRSGPLPYHKFNARSAHPTVETTADRRHLIVNWPEAGGLKAGTYGSWIALIRGGGAFLQTIDYDSKGCYLEESSVQAWVSVEMEMCEIETTSPHWFLRPGEHRDWTVRWELVELRSEEPEAIAGQLDQRRR